MPSAIPTASYSELEAAPHMPPAAFAGRYWGIGRDRLRRIIERGDFPVPVLRVGQGFYVLKPALLNSLGITPMDLRVLAQMEREAAADDRNTVADLEVA